MRRMGALIAQVISLDELKAIINQVQRIVPIVRDFLSLALRDLAQLYGMLIYVCSQSIDIDELDNDNGLLDFPLR